MNRNLIICMALLVTGSQALPHQTDTYADLRTVDFNPNANLFKWIEIIAIRLQQIIDSTFSDWVLAIDDIEAETKYIIDDLVNDYDVEQYARENQNAGDCITEHVNRLASIGSGGVQGLKTCATQALDKLVQLQGSLQKHVEKIRAESRKIVNVVQQCKADRNSTVICIRDNLKEIVASVKIILNEALELLIASNVQAKVIAEQAKKCVKAVADNVRSQTLNSHGILTSCLENALRP